nr:AIF_HP1_G0030620.mRNA.1.CDS.1 [Saccharomyces cerevisiae]
MRKQILNRKNLRLSENKDEKDVYLIQNKCKAQKSQYYLHKFHYDQESIQHDLKLAAPKKEGSKQSLNSKYITPMLNTFEQTSSETVRKEFDIGKRRYQTFIKLRTPTRMAGYHPST